LNEKKAGKEMKKVIKRIGLMLITLFFVSLLVFLAFSLIPSDPATNILGMEASQESIDALREEMGLNKNVFVRYGEWVFAAIQGDFGTSYSYQTSVSDLLGEKIGITLFLSFFSFLILLVFSIPLAVYTAKRKGNFIDSFFTWIGQFNMAIPPFFMGILMTYIFGIVLRIFIPGQFISYRENFWGFFLYLILPAISITIPKIAMTVRILRGAIIDETSKDYVRTAYSRGNDSRRVYYKHILKNAFIPFVTFAGMILTDLLVGSIIVEQVFGIPGLGRILLISISNRDYPVVQAAILFIAFFVLLVNSLIEILYQVIDPKVKSE
jgi:ABC-type dipeptide/oligopeptide/nickel transport system permease component